MNDRVRPYVRQAVKLRYSPEDPPPREPPLGVGLFVGPGVWRVLASWWYDHQPDAGGRVCRTCYRLCPCPGLISADGGMDSLIRRSTARGIAAAPKIYPHNRNI